MSPALARTPTAEYLRLMPQLQREGFAHPDQARTFPNGKNEGVHLGEVAVGRFRICPGLP